MAAEPFSGADLALLFERAPRFVERLRAAPAAESAETYFDCAVGIALAMPEAEQLELLDAHPRIGAPAGSVSALSYREQGYDTDAGSAALQARLDQLNAAYEGRFGFRFVVFVAGRSRAEIADVIERQLAAERDVEKERALRDVIAIARDRAARLGIGQGVAHR